MKSILCALWVIATFFGIICSAEDSNNQPYDYYGQNQLDHYYRRQYGYGSQTSPNVMQMLDQPGVAASLFFSGAGALANFAYTAFASQALQNTLDTATSTISTNTANLRTVCTKLNELLNASPSDAIGTQSITSVSVAATAGTCADSTTPQTAITALQTRLDAILNVAATTCP